MLWASPGCEGTISTKEKKPVSKMLRNAWIALAILALVTMATACGGSQGSSSTSSANVAAVIKGLDNPFFQAMQQGHHHQ